MTTPGINMSEEKMRNFILKSYYDLRKMNTKQSLKFLQEAVKAYGFEDTRPIILLKKNRKFTKIVKEKKTNPYIYFVVHTDEDKKSLHFHLDNMMSVKKNGRIEKNIEGLIKEIIDFDNNEAKEIAKMYR